MKEIIERMERLERLLLIAGKAVLTTEETALFLGISRGHLLHMTAAREVPHYRKGNKCYFRKSELEAWMTESKIETEKEIQAEAATYCIVGRQAR
jgi:excisionase family DNA binding protein